jgi:iron complex outermembrane receptor protein
VVGKGAAALMVLGGVKHVYTDVISTPALDLFKTYGVEVAFSVVTDRIVNRTKDGLCPVETLCLDLDSPADMLNEIRQFINNRTNG